MLTLVCISVEVKYENVRFQPGNELLQAITKYIFEHGAIIPKKILRLCSSPDLGASRAKRLAGYYIT